MNFKVRKKVATRHFYINPQFTGLSLLSSKNICIPSHTTQFLEGPTPPFNKGTGGRGVPTMIFQFHSCTHYIYVSVCPRKIWVWHWGNNFLYVLLAWCCFPKINMIQVCSKTPELVNDMPNYFSVKQFSDDFLMVSLIIFWS